MANKAHAKSPEDVIEAVCYGMWLSCEKDAKAPDYRVSIETIAAGLTEYDLQFFRQSTIDKMLGLILFYHPTLDDAAGEFPDEDLKGRTELINHRMQELALKYGTRSSKKGR